ncbi:hypothetical protein BH11PSE10_BH11PSE10_16150 [soil metagenome]
MNKNRHDIYAFIHKALRALMFDTVQRLGCMDVNDPADKATALAQADSLLSLLQAHVSHENEFVHAALEARRPRSSSITADAHLEHLDGIESLGAEIDVLRLAPSSEQARTSASRLYRHMAVFVAENLQHMALEESDNNAALWACYSDAELMDIHDRLLASVEPAHKTQSLHWMLAALNPLEVAELLGGMRTQMPPPVFEGIAAMARQRLGARAERVMGVLMPH